jgi:protease-4
MNEPDKHSESPSQSNPLTPGWEKAMLEKLAYAALNEQKIARRWGVFFKLLTFSYLLIVLGIYAYPQFGDSMDSAHGDHIAVISVLGEIGEGQVANAEHVIEGLRDASEDRHTKGILLSINSPGGSPVQSAYIYDEIRRIKQQQPNLPIYAVVGDICASGGYYIAAATDKIFVNAASLIGSIGVVMNGFGFTAVLDKLGVERRLLTAGEHKAMLDPFSPANARETEHMQSLLNQVHQQFIDAVKLGRGDRLKLTEASILFSGLVWTGAESVKLGLADGFGSVDSVARDELGLDNTVDFTPQERLIDRLAGKIGASFGHAIASHWGGQALH